MVCLATLSGSSWFNSSRPPQPRLNADYLMALIHRPIDNGLDARVQPGHIAAACQYSDSHGIYSFCLISSGLRSNPSRIARAFMAPYQHWTRTNRDFAVRMHVYTHAQEICARVDRIRLIIPESGRASPYFAPRHFGTGLGALNPSIAGPGCANMRAMGRRSIHHCCLGRRNSRSSRAHGLLDGRHAQFAALIAAADDRRRRRLRPGSTVQ